MNTNIETTGDTTNPVKIQRFTKNLKVELSKDEIIERAQRQARLAEEIGLKEEERDSAKKHANARIEELEAEAKRLLSEIRDGATWKEVACETRFVYRLGVVHEVRTDTQEVMSERAMTDRERQLELPDAGSSGTGGDPDEDDDNDQDDDTDIPGTDIDEEPDTSILNGGGDDDEDSGIVDDDYPAKSEPPLATQKKTRAKKAANGKGGKGARKGKGSGQ
jgi:hypothetical protein